jgi:hypothetical protein
MLNIYIGHATCYDYKNDLYIPIKKTNYYNQLNIILPHDQSDDLYDSINFFKNCDLVIAEGSYPSTGLGIELGCAYFLNNVPITAIYKSGFKLSTSIKSIATNIIEYTDSNDLIEKLNEFLYSFINFKNN